MIEKRKENKIRCEFKLDSRLHKVLKIHANENDTTVADIVNDALNNYLKIEEKIGENENSEK